MIEISFGDRMRNIVVFAVLLSVYCVIAGCNCCCGSERSCTSPGDSNSVAVESSVTVEFSSGTLAR